MIDVVRAHDMKSHQLRESQESDVAAKTDDQDREADTDEESFITTRVTAWADYNLLRS